MDRSTYLSIRAQIPKSWSSTPSLVPFAINCMFFLGVMFSASHLEHSAFRFLLVPLISFFIFRNFSLMHDAVHHAISKKRATNNIVGVVTGAWCFLPFEMWKKSHLEHHVWTGNIDKDPVTAIITAFPKMSPWLRFILSLSWQAWFPTLAIMQYGVFWLLSQKNFFRAPTVAAGISLLSPLVIWGSFVAVVPTHFLLTVCLPALFLYFVLVEVVNFPHHLELPQFHGETRFPLWEQYKVARTCIYPKWFAEQVVLNFNYHIEHHMFPDVPWHMLSGVYDKVRHQLGSSYNTDPMFEWIVVNKKRSMADVLGGVVPPEIHTEKAS